MLQLQKGTTSMLENIPAAFGHAISAVRPGLDKIVFHDQEFAAPDTIELTSDAFAPDGPIPERFTADGAKVSPPLRFGRVPPDAMSLVLVVEDADSPTPSPLCHALVWDIAAGDGGFQESALDRDSMPTTRVGTTFGKNSLLGLGWLPPDPPPGHGPHRYAFELFALDRAPDLVEGAGRAAVVAALKGHVVAKGLLVGTYERR